MANIGIDLDDVLVDFMTMYTCMANEIHGKPPLGTLPIDWEWSNYDLSKAEQDVVWARVAQTENFWESLPVEQGASVALVQELDRLHNLSFITARVKSHGDTVRNQSCRWLEDNFGVNYPQVTVAYDKGALAAALKLDYFIDDRPKNVLEIKNAVPTCVTYIKDSSHNQPFVDPRIPRVKNFDEFARIVLGG
jgi:5'(3')-deoxyribonucleotidase